MPEYIDINAAASIMGKHRATLWRHIAADDYRAKTQSISRGGKNGESYLIDVSSLPPETQIAIIAITDGFADAGECDLAGYRERYGTEGIEELLKKQRAAKEGIAIRQLNPKDIVARLNALAEEYGVSTRTLYRWMDAYEQQGLNGIMKPIKRSDAGKATSICPAALQYAASLYLGENKRSCARVFEMLQAKAAAMGTDACERCGFCEGTDMRRYLLETEAAADYPICTEQEHNGMRIPECRQTLGRILNAISPEMRDYARRGSKYWKDTYMQMGKREKPQTVNECWFGDHHQFDCFVLDTDGKPVRPWITAWYDAASNCLVGWLLSTNPNTETIMMAMARAIAHTQHDEFYGVPKCIYIDNGKDYRSKAFDTGLGENVNYGRIDGDMIASCSLTQLLNITITYALPYQGWSKNVERFFGTIERKWIKEVPGWCGSSPDERPQDFHRVLADLLKHNKLWTMDDFYEYLRDTVFPEYHRMENEGIGGRKPLDVYQSLPRARSDEPSASMLDIMRQKMCERVVGQQGIRFKNKLYWDDALIGMAGKHVVIRYSEEDLETISVLLDGKHLCAASLKETLLLCGEDADKVAAHVAAQKKQQRNVRESIRKATRSIFVDDVVAETSGGNVTSIEHEKAYRARQTAKKTARKSPVSDGGAADAMFAALGKELLNKKQA